MREEKRRRGELCFANKILRRGDERVVVELMGDVEWW